MLFGSSFLDQIQKLQVESSVGADDFVDKLNSKITACILIIAASIVAAKEYFHDPIACYMPTNVGGMNLLKYVEDYCWVQGTIPIGLNETIPDDNITWEDYVSRRMINYYQWVPFVLGLQCVLFYMPRLIWTLLINGQAGSDLQNIIMSASELSNKCAPIDSVVNAVYSILTSKNNVHLNRIQNKQGRKDKKKKHKPPIEKDEEIGTCSQDMVKTETTIRSHRFSSKYSQKFLLLTYLMIKLLYLANSIGQIFLMQRFFSAFGGQVYGFAVLMDLLNNRDWRYTLLFPRVGFCAVPVRAIGVHGNLATAQCVLAINMLNEKIFIFLWFWIILISIANLYSLFRWIYRKVTVNKNLCKTLERYIITDAKKLPDKIWIDSNEVKRSILPLLAERERIELEIYEIKDNFEKLDISVVVHEPVRAKIFADFCNGFITQDGFFIIQMINSNAGFIVTCKLVAQIWMTYLKEQAYQMLHDQVDLSHLQIRSNIQNLDKRKPGKTT